MHSKRSLDSVNGKPLPCPVTIVGGYLGSGKTTLINHLLSQADGSRLAILVNDFGELAIDAQLIEGQEGDVISLSGGCVCCSYGNDLTGALLQLNLDVVDQVVIESSGVALPGAISGSLSLLSEYVVSSIVVLIDASTIQRHAKDKYLADTIERQLASADLIAINKVDLISDEQQWEISDWLKQDYASLSVIEVQESKIPKSLLLIASQHSMSVKETTKGPSDRGHDASIYCTFSLNLPAEYDIAGIACKLAGADNGLLRVKGFIKDLNGAVHTLQMVGSRWSVDTAPEGVSCGLMCIGLKDLCDEEQINKLIESN